MAEVPAAPEGFETYQQYCARCHGPDGSGVAGSYPPLRNLDHLWQDRRRAVEAVLGGRASPIELPGQQQWMPTHGFLSNETVAATLTFLQNEWGPGGKQFTPEEVAAERLRLLEAHPGDYPELPSKSPLAEMGAVQYVTSDGPPMTVEEFDRALELYYGRCTACHGVLREGTAGSPLTPDIMQAVGTEYLREVIGFGSSKGMPGWGTTDQLSGTDIDLLARFLQHPVPQPPDLDEAGIRASWQLLTPPSERPKRPPGGLDTDQLFAVTLHDVGQVLIIDGPTRRILSAVETGRGPHRVRASASGRYLYVIARDGVLTLIDLYADPPARVAEVRIGFEARAVGASRRTGYEDRFALAGAYWPPHLVLVDGRTLEPLRVLSTRSRSVRSKRYHPEPRVSDVAGSVEQPEFIAHIKETGHSYLIPYDDLPRLRIQDLPATPDLRTGSFADHDRYYVTPADSNAISVIDTEQREIIAEVPARVFGAGQGTTFDHPQYGPIWLVSTMVDDALIGIGVDPAEHPDFAWRQVINVPTPGAGSMFVTTHPGSPHLWVDAPLNPDRAISQSVAVYDKGDLAAGFRTLPIASWAGVNAVDARAGVTADAVPSRVLKPTFDPSGREVWLVVWNPQDQSSALVVIDDAKLEPLAVLDDPRIITPTRVYSVAALRQGDG